MSRADLLRSIADTLDARVDTEQPLSLAEMRTLSEALRDLGYYAWAEAPPRRPQDATQNAIIQLRPSWPTPKPGA